MTTMTSKAVEFDATGKTKGFGRGWGHGYKYQKADKHKKATKPKKYKDFKQERDGKFAVFEDEDCGAIEKDVHLLEQVSYMNGIIANSLYLTPKTVDVFETMSSVSQEWIYDHEMYQDFMWFGYIT